MTVRDFWEVLTFQVSWADSNIFIVLLAIVVLIFGIMVYFVWLVFLRHRQFISTTKKII